MGWGEGRTRDKRGKMEKTGKGLPKGKRGTGTDGCTQNPNVGRATAGPKLPTVGGPPGTKSA